MEAWIWAECGEGELLKVTSIRADWWIVTGYSSWCCTPGTTLYLFDSTDERATMMREMQRQLVRRRESWKRGVFCQAH